MILDELLPRYDVHEYHSRWVPAPTNAVYAAARELRLSEISGVVSALLAIRELPERLLLRHAGRELKGEAPMLSEMMQNGFALLADSQTEIVLGLIGDVWSLSPRSAPIDGREAFVASNEATLAKVACNISILEDKQGTRISTETRVAVAEPRARRRFLAYWALIRVPSGLIRRLWLRAIADKAMAGVRAELQKVQCAGEGGQ